MVDLRFHSSDDRLAAFLTLHIALNAARQCWRRRHSLKPAPCRSRED
jgi:hypothetical protein